MQGFSLFWKAQHSEDVWVQPHHYGPRFISTASVCHRSSCLPLLVLQSCWSVCGLPLKLPRWTLWKQSGPPRNADAGQPGHLCVLFMDLPHNGASRKARCFSYVCKMNVWFKGMHMKSSVAFWGTCIQADVKIHVLSGAESAGIELQENLGWKGCRKSLVQSPTLSRVSSETWPGYLGRFAVMAWKLLILTKHPAMPAIFLLGWVYQESEMQMKQCVGYNIQLGWFSQCHQVIVFISCSVTWHGHGSTDGLHTLTRVVPTLLWSCRKNTWQAIFRSSFSEYQDRCTFVNTNNKSMKACRRRVKWES